MAFVPYDDGTVSDVEYESVKFNDLTSCYTYNPLFTALSIVKLGEKNADNYMQFTYPNATIKFNKSKYDGYLDLIWLKGRPAFNKEGTVLVPNDGNIDVITKMDLQKYRFVIDNIYTTIAQDKKYELNTKNAQTYTDFQTDEVIRACSWHWENVENGKHLELISPVIRYVDGDEQLLFYPHSITDFSSITGYNKTGLIEENAVAHSSVNNIFLSLLDIDKSYNLPPLGNQFLVASDDNKDIVYIWYNQSERIVYLYNAFSYNKFLECLALLGVYFRIGGVDYLGFMDSSGQTTGEYLTEENWDKSSQYNSNTINNFT